MGTGGLLRLPQFLRSFVRVVASEQEHRGSSTPSLLNPAARWDDVFLSLKLAIIVLSLRIFLESKVFSKLFSGFTGHKRQRLGENLFYSVCYTLAFSFYLFVLRPSVDWSAPLLRNENVIVPILMDPFPPPMNWAERFYYAQAMGFYFAGSVFLLAFDSRRSDFRELAIHHVATLGLIAISYGYGYVRVGIYVIALHDVGDIFLYAAKFLHHFGYAGWDTAVFAVFTVTFYITRLLMYARMVYAITVETLITVVENPSLCGWAMYFDTYIVHYFVFAVLLGTLLVLHCFWFALMLKMIYRELFLGKKISEEGDIRSDDEDDEKMIEGEGQTENGSKRS